MSRSGREGDLQAARGELETLNDQLAGLRRELAADYVPRRQLARRAALAAVAVVLLVVVAVTVNRVTLQQAQERTRAQAEEYVRVLVRECTFNAARLTPAQVQSCERKVPNFAASRAAAAARAKDYDALRRWAISRGWKPPPTTAPPR